MIIYQNDKSGFLRDALSSDIEDVVRSQFHERTGRSVGISEFRSWRESLVAVAKVVNDDSLPGDCQVGIEYQIPQTAKRIDFLITGQDAERRDQLCIVELKQWERAEKTAKDAVVRTRFRDGERETPHPSYQAWSYASLLRHFNRAVYEGGIELFPCAYLHNCLDAAALYDSFYDDYLEKAPLFCKGDRERGRLRECLRGRLVRGDRSSILRRVDRAETRPSKGLVEALRGMLDGNPAFILVDDQKLAYETALHAARNASVDAKRIVIVEGGPGTGKSVVAVNLMVALTAEGQVVRYVTKNAAPRQVFESRLSGTRRRSEISMMFGGSGEFTDVKPNTFDTLVVDEAHRLNEKSGLYANRGEHQIKEIISAAKCAIFFLDEDQRVTWKDVGSVKAIRSKAPGNASIEKETLASQFRCNGSEGYLAWLDDVFQIRRTANTTLDAAQFDFRVFDSPESMRREIVSRNEPENKARMVAGYCWDWKSRRDARAIDVVIPEHQFGMQWNLASDAGLWIISPYSVEQIGCIHTCQGLEVDYIGVIIGPDLTVRDGKILTHPEKRSRQDQSLKGFRKLHRTDPASACAKADALIKNTYRTLMTRGMKGCYVYCTDSSLSEYLKQRAR
ncbi:MAG: DNA/RNA helicase domain-containing protein [Steroidobacteraceae bacterium]